MVRVHVHIGTSYVRAFVTGVLLTICFYESVFWVAYWRRNAIPTIYVITPTYTRHVQKAELTRMKQALKHVPKIHWIVVEDSDKKTQLVIDFLQKSGILYTHLHVTTATQHRILDRRDTVHRGTLQRNLAIAWIRDNVDDTDGVVYFADDDNTYDEGLFEEMRYTQVVSVWPAGFTGGQMYEGPICRNDKVTGWLASWHLKRNFQLDMSSFAVNVNMLFEYPDAKFDLRSRLGHQETDFLDQIVTIDELEPKSCTKILVWHTRTEDPRLHYEEHLRNVSRLYRTLVVAV